MAQDVDVTPESNTPVRMRQNSDGSLTPYVFIENDSGSGANASGTITTQNLVPAGVATAGSAVEIDLSDGDMSTLSIQTVGVFTGVLSIQACLDGVHWITVGGATALTNLNTAAQTATIASALQSIFQMDISGFPQVRVTALAAVTGSVIVTLIGTDTTGLVALDAPVTIGTLPALPAGAALIGQVTPNTTVSSISLVTAASTNATSSKTTAGSLYELTISNPTSTAAYVKLYNKASAPTVGTDVPVMTIAIPATAAGVGEKSFNFGALGKRFATGIALAVTGAAIATDTSVAVAGVQIHGSYI